jgi:hypothetical protein
MKLTDQQKKLMRKLFEENGLVREDVFAHKHFVIITRAGIEKIQANNGIDCSFDIISSDGSHCAVSCTATTSDKSIVAYSSANSINHNSGYYMEVAIKRARARAVLGLMELYKLGAFGEDEDVEAGDYQAYGLDR